MQSSIHAKHIGRGVLCLALVEEKDNSERYLKRFTANEGKAPTEAQLR